MGVRREGPVGDVGLPKGFLNPAVATYATAAVLLTVALDASAQQNAGFDQALVDQGKAGYAEKCSHCHGPGMANSGTITPDLRKFPDDKERFFTTVKSGKNNKMPPWGDILTDEQITSLWAYVSSQRKP